MHQGGKKELNLPSLALKKKRIHWTGMQVTSTTWKERNKKIKSLGSPGAMQPCWHTCFSAEDLLPSDLNKQEIINCDIKTSCWRNSLSCYMKWIAILRKCQLLPFKCTWKWWVRWFCISYKAFSEHQRWVGILENTL